MIRRESILTSAINDKEAQEDGLGFAPYVDALAAFLVNDATKPPLTVSIEGEWGSGKSSFMRQLEKRITDHESPDKGSRSFRVWFNPWRHDKQEALWAAFALAFLAQVREQTSRKRRWRGDWSLFCARFTWKRGLTDLVRKALEAVWWGLVILMLGIFSWNAPAYLRAVRGASPTGQSTKSAIAKDASRLPTTGLDPGFPDWIIRSGGFSGTAVLALYLLNLAKKQLANPFKIDLQKHLGCPRYEGSISFVEEFHRDFPRILSACADERRVYVFIDDLDRCEVPRAAELMQAINLMISNDHRLVFVIGMDWDTVAAGMAVKNEAIARYLTHDRAPLSARGATDVPSTGDAGLNRALYPASARESHTDSQDTIQFGRDFMEKFVQLRFKVPRPSHEDLRRLLLTLSRPAAASTDHTGSQRRQPWGAKLLKWRRGQAVGTRKRAEGSREGAPPATEAIPQRGELQRLFEFDASADSTSVQTVTLKLMSAFDNNPRRLKQFLGLYRLRIYIAQVTGMFDIANGRSGDRALTLEQLGKFTALELGCPDLLREAQRDRKLLDRLERVALGGGAGEVYWLQRRGLRAVLQAGLDGDESTRQQWSLADLDLSQLLSISPYIGAFDAKNAGGGAAPEETPRSQSESAQGWFTRGLAAEHKSEKLRCYDEAIRLKPDYVAAYINRGNAHSASGNADAALRDYVKAIDLQPDHAVGLYNRGLAYGVRGDVRLALQDYNRSIDLDPDGGTFNNRGIEMVFAGEIRRALEDFDEAIRLMPSDADAYYNRGIARYRKGDLKSAVVDYNQAILLKPNDPDLFVNRAITLLAIGDESGAQMDLDKARLLESRP